MQVEHQPAQHRFIVSLAAGQARLEYSLQETWVNIVHTWVPDSLRGQGVAGQLMQAVVEQLKSKGLRAVPTCSYAVKWFAEHRSETEAIK